MDGCYTTCNTSLQDGRELARAYVQLLDTGIRSHLCLACHSTLSHVGQGKIPCGVSVHLQNRRWGGMVPFQFPPVCFPASIKRTLEAT